MDSIQLFKGDVAFVSDAPLELIKASSDEIAGVININSRHFAFRVPMNSFEGFNSDLQRIHFQENYLETHRYPIATFEGKIVDEINFKKPDVYYVRGKGSMIVHGIKREMIISTRITVLEDSLKIQSEFVLELDDHNIRIPRIVNQKIARQINVSISLFSA